MLNLQIDQTALINAIAAIIAKELLQNTITPPTIVPTPTIADEKPNHPLPKPSMQTRIDHARRRFAALTWCPPTPSEEPLYYAWFKEFGYNPISASFFLEYVKETNNIRLIPFLREPNTTTGVGLKLSEYSAHHPWLQRALVDGSHFYGIPRK